VPACPGILPLLFVVMLGALLPSVSAQASSVDTCLAAHEQAQTARHAGQLLQAHKASLSCAQASCPKPVRAECTSWYEELDRTVPSLVFAVRSRGAGDLADVRVYANGKLLTERTDGRALSLDPGAYTLRFEAAGHQPSEEQVVVRVGEQNRVLHSELTRLLALQVAAPPARDAAAPAHDRRRVAAYVLAGSSVAALSLYAGFGLHGKREHDRLERSCSPDCSEEQVADARRSYVLANVFAALAGASAVAATILYFRSGKRRQEQPGASRASITPALGGAMVGYGTQF
jgi:hypothetical protein